MTKQLERYLSLHDFETAARKHLPAPLFAYIEGGAEDNLSIRRNRDVFERWGFVTRVLTDVSKIEPDLTIFGQHYSHPIGIAPMGLGAISAYRADIVLARAAAAHRVPMILSGSSLTRLEDVVAAAPDLWFQAYLPGNTAQIDALLDRVAAAAVKTLVLTVDTPVAANRENNLRAGFSAPLKPNLRIAWQGVRHPRWLTGTFLRTLFRHGVPHFENNYAERGVPIISRSILRNFSDRGHLSWEHFRAIRKRWRGPMVLKGVLAPADAVKAAAEGIDGIIVSNHGGRQLDGAAPPLAVLPRIVDAVPGLPVMLDSGVRRGTDVVKALALGARMVFVGRPFNYAAAVAGEPGVSRALDLICTELTRNMALLGVRCLAEIDASVLHDFAASVSAPAEATR